MAKKEDESKTRLIHIRLSEELHKTLRIRVAELDTSIQKWVESLIEKNLGKHK
ncbi:MAG: hypothetical protein GF307_15180 [candidate division Zixibacteria bacterium]|nr:hypothetical protein [candidate division Zixibacteria bacterium]